jgi:hypothetical protein|nr:MAG TPA: hypothetical protein [Caudoviricetes sp.]
MAKKIIRHSYRPDTSVYQSSLEIEETNQNNNNQPSQPQVIDEEDKLDSTVSLINNRFHLDESVMIVYDPIKDDLIIAAREGNNSGGGSNSQVMQELAKKLNIDGTNMNMAVFSSFLANKDFTNVDLSYLKNILELNLLAKKDGSDIDIEKIKERLGVINNSQPSGVTREELLEAIRNLASKSGYDIDVEVIKNRLGIDTTVLAKVDASNISVDTWKQLLGITDLQEGEGINTSSWATKLKYADGEAFNKLKDTAEGVNVDNWRSKLNIPDTTNLTDRNDLNTLKGEIQLDLRQKAGVNGENISVTLWKDKLGISDIDKLANKDASDIDVEALKRRLNLGLEELAKKDGTDIDAEKLKERLGLNNITADLNPILKATSNEIDVDAWKTKLGITTSEIKEQAGIEGVLKATSSGIDVAAWKKLLSEDTVSGDDFE